MILSPVSTLVTSGAGMVECLPCVGCLADLLANAVQMLICGISCGCGTASFLIVMGTVYIIMRPLWGGVMLGGAVVCCCLAALLGHNHHQATKGQGDQRDVELNDLNS